MSESSEYRPIACGLHDRLEALATTGGFVQIVVRTPDGGRLTIEDRLVDVFARGGEEFVRTGRGELIRLDHLESVDGEDFQSDEAPQGEQGGGEELRVRFATATDIPEMHRIRTAVRENRLVDPESVQPRDYEVLMRAGGRAWVAELEGQMVGFAAADLRRFNVWALFVTPSCEGRGFGRRLHDRMMDWVFSEGARHMWLSTDPGTRAESFYADAGWQYVGQEANGEVRYEFMREWWLERLKSTGE